METEFPNGRLLLAFTKENKKIKKRKAGFHKNKLKKNNLKFIRKKMKGSPAKVSIPQEKQKNKPSLSFKFLKKNKKNWNSEKD